MKKYFAKFLPVEGEIKMGDKFIDTGVMNMIGTRNNEEGEYDFQKVKLFLCSRDIQVGDTDVHCRGGILTAILPTDIEIFGNGNDDEFFKVIGEISPNAIWVKDGDEFNDSEIGILFNFAGEDSDDELFTIEEFPKAAKRWYGGKIPKYIDPPIAIKCSQCQTFH